MYPVVRADDVEFPTPRVDIWRQGHKYSPGDKVRCKNNRACTRKRAHKDGEEAEPESDEENLTQEAVVF